MSPFEGRGQRWFPQWKETSALAFGVSVRQGFYSLKGELASNYTLISVYRPFKTSEKYKTMYIWRKREDVTLLQNPSSFAALRIFRTLPLCFRTARSVHIAWSLLWHRLVLFCLNLNYQCLHFCWLTGFRNRSIGRNRCNCILFQQPLCLPINFLSCHQFTVRFFTRKFQ